MHVRVVEVGPRDGLQNEPCPLNVEQRIALIDRLSAAGLPEIEVGSFVSPKWVPQMADTDRVLAGIHRREGTRYPVLVPNRKGFDGAQANRVADISIFTAASDAFNLKNTNATVDESLKRLGEVARLALESGMRVRGYVSCVLGCPYQGEVAVSRVVEVAEALVSLGCHEVSLGDTIGIGTPLAARTMFQACADAVGAERLAVHFHDTRGQALANVLACLEAGARAVDASVGGLGGCPYAPGASGNLATEDLLYMLDGMGCETGVDSEAVRDTARWVSALLNRPPASRTARIA